MIIASPETYAVAYSDYHYHEGYIKRASLLQRFPQPIAIVGCGFGFLVAELRRLGIEAQGFDASDYCRINSIVSIYIHDICALPLPVAFPTLITEDLLPWLTDAEAVYAAKNCALSAKIVLHLVTEQGQADYNYHSTGYWMRLTKQLTVSLEGM